MKRSKINVGLKSSAVLLVATFITHAMSFITTPIFTRIMSVEEYGLVAQYNSWLNIITIFATLSLAAGVFQVAMNEFRDDRNRYTFSSLILSNSITTFLFIFVFIFHDFFCSLFELPLSLLIIMYLYLMLYPAMNTWLAKQRYEYNYKRVFIISVGSATISQIVAVVLVLNVNGINLGVVKVWATAGSLCLASLAIYLSIAFKAKFKPSFHYIKFAFLFNAPLIVHYLAQYILHSTDKIMITHFLGEGATGIYSLGTTVATLATILWSAMSASLTPYIYHRLNNKDYKSINKVVCSVELFFGIGCVFVSLIGPEVVYILGSEKYMSGIQLIPPIAASCIVKAVYDFYSTVAFYNHKRLSTAIMTFIAGTVNIALNLILIPRYGIVAAAYTTEISYLLYAFLHFLNYRFIVRKKRIYNDKLVFLILISCSAVCIGLGFIYNHPIARYIILGIGLCVLIVFSKKIFTFLKSIAIVKTGEEQNIAESKQDDNYKIVRKDSENE